MRILRVPLPLKLATFILFLTPLVFLIEILIARRVSWWALETHSFRLALILFSAPVIFLAYQLCRGKTWVIQAFRGLGFVWVIISFYLTLRDANTVLGIFSVLLTIGWLNYGFFVAAIFRLPYLYSGKTWYESLPSRIPGLSCEGFPVSRIGMDGAFVLAGEGVFPDSVYFDYKGRKLACPIEPIAQLVSQSTANKGLATVGTGLQFKGKNKDFLKDLADFVEMLRGEGHVI